MLGCVNIHLFANCHVNQFPWSFADEGVLIEAIEEMRRHDLSSILFAPRMAYRVVHSLVRKQGRSHVGASAPTWF